MYPNIPQERSTIQFFWEHRSISPEFRTGVSLHSHTMFSEECLDVLPKYVGKLPFLGKSLESDVIDYNKAYWTPPLSARQAHRLEEKQIQRQLQLPGLVSLTDHDSIQAASLLRSVQQFEKIPISVEWSVPFGSTFFHIGVHNLPTADAANIMHELGEFTANPAPEKLRNILAGLRGYPDVLLVLNHPLWDEKPVGQAEHKRELSALLAVSGEFLHALELNGLRSWSENREVIALAATMNLPVVSGGDRHGCEPNALLNLTEATTFSDFVQEIRKDRRSHIVLMPQYRESLNWRTAQVVIDILREYPSSFAGRRLWTERVFYRHPEGPLSMAAMSWKHGTPPKMFGMVNKSIGIVQLRWVQSLMRYVLSGRGSEWNHENVRAIGGAHPA